MRYEERVPEELFEESGHYLGRPADFNDRIIHRRVKLTESIPGFTGKDKTLLDIGCGNGASVFLMAPKMKKCVGIEISKQNAAEFKKYKAEHAIDNCEIRSLDVVNSKPGEQFDRIISFEVIEHLSDEKKGMQYYYEALKDDGLVAITVPNKWWIFETHGASLPLLPWNRVPFFSWLPRPLHEKWANARIYTKKRIRRLLEESGFEVTEISYVTAPMDVLPDGKFKKWVIKTFFNSETTKVPFKATSLFVAARKK